MCVKCTASLLGPALSSRSSTCQPTSRGHSRDAPLARGSVGLGQNTAFLQPVFRNLCRPATRDSFIKTMGNIVFVELSGSNKSPGRMATRVVRVTRSRRCQQVAFIGC